MKAKLLIIWTIFFGFVGFNCYSQDLFPASINEIIFKGDFAFLIATDQPFTGKLFDEKNRELGTFRKGSKDGMFTEYFHNGNKKSEGRYVAGLKEGTHHEWFENGKRKNQMNYSDNALNGEAKEYYSNGKTKFSANYQKGEKNGKYTEWHENGRLKKEIQYQGNNIIDTKVAEYDHKGNIISELHCKSGKIDSELFYKDNRKIEYFNYDLGIKKAEGQIKEDLKDGLWTEWYENGNTKFKGIYHDGERNGKGVEYDDQGNETWNGEYVKGEIHGKGTLIQGVIKYEGQWNLGRRDGNFTQTGSDGVQGQGQYVNDVKEGFWTEQYANGTKKLEAHYTNGEIVNGEYNEWHENGQKKEVKTLVDGEIDGNHTIWFSNGIVNCSINYLKGRISDGQYFYRDDRGDNLREENYSKGILVSEYTYAGKLKDGPFAEYYSDGSKKIIGNYSYGKRNIGQRYGVNRTVNQVAKGTGTIILILFLAMIAPAG